MVIMYGLLMELMDVVVVSITEYVLADGVLVNSVASLS